MLIVVIIRRLVKIKFVYRKMQPKIKYKNSQYHQTLSVVDVHYMVWPGCFGAKGGKNGLWTPEIFLASILTRKVHRAKKRYLVKIINKDEGAKKKKEMTKQQMKQL